MQLSAKAQEIAERFKVRARAAIRAAMEAGALLHVDPAEANVMALRAELDLHEAVQALVVAVTEEAARVIAPS